MSNFALIQLDPFAVLSEWDSFPDYISWPNGNSSHGVAPGIVHDKWAAVPVVHTPDQPNEFCRITGYSDSFGGTSVIRKLEWTRDNLDDVKTELAARVDAQAERQRGKYITLGSGQALTYQAKLLEAQDALAGGSNDYPFLSATIGIDGATLLDVAKSVHGQASKWTMIGAAIEKSRKSAKFRIAAASDVDAAIAEYVKVDWTVL